MANGGRALVTLLVIFVAGHSISAATAAIEALAAFDGGLTQCPEGLPRGTASIEIMPKVYCLD